MAKIIRDAGRDANRRRLVIALCEACGGEFTNRRDFIRSGAVRRCKDCKHSKPIASASPAAQGTAEQPLPAMHTVQTTAEPHSSLLSTPKSNVAQSAEPEKLPERTPEYLTSQIQAKAAALLKLDTQSDELTQLLRLEGVQPPDANGDSVAKLLREVLTTAKALRAEKRRLESELRDLTAQKARSASKVALLADRLAALKKGASA